MSAWYDVFPARLVLEFTRVQKLNRGFRLRRVAAVVYWDGKICDAPEGLAPEPLHVCIIYPEAFPAVRPYVMIVSPKIGMDEIGHAWHRWMDGQVCIVEPGYWQMSTADEVIEKVADWYFNYTARKSGLIDKMPDIGRAAIPIAPMPTTDQRSV
jgi:hypothetical protein